MANIKISELANGETLEGTEYIPIIQNGQLVKTTSEEVAALGGGGSPVSFAPIVVFNETGISASNWQSSVPDGSTAQGSRWNIGKDGTYEAVAGEYVNCTASNNLRFNVGVNGSYYLLGIKVKVDPDFQPIQTDNWHSASTLFGMDLSETQRDYAAIIDKNGYFALGTGTNTITSSNISALDDGIHEVFVLATGNKIILYVDGAEAVSVNITMYRDQMWRQNFMWNGGYNTRIQGKVYALGVWTACYETDNVILPTI